MQVGDKVRDAGGRLGTVVEVRLARPSNPRWVQWGAWCDVQWSDLAYGDYTTHPAEWLVLASDQDRLDRNPQAKAAITQGQADLENGDVVTIDMFKTRASPLDLSKIPGIHHLPSVNRVEVIDHRNETDAFKARAWGVGPADIDVAISFQDDDRTLKVFVRDGSAK